jgi:tripartite-type tricarboxylate transporter receptor subunit TctC
MRTFTIAAAIAASTLACAHEAAAQAYPSKPIRVFVSSTAGGPLDVFTRLVTRKMEERLKQPFVIENRGGAGGNLAVTATLQAPADGYSILFAIDTTFTVNPALFQQIPFDPEKDLVPVSVMAKFGQVLGVPPSLPVNSVKELKELSLKSDLNYGSAGNALPSHLSFAYLQAVTGIRATHIPYRGNPPTLLALINGDVQSVMVISTSLLPLAKEGKVKMLAYSDRTRSEVVPDVPTVAEQGYPDFEVVFAYVLMVPTGTPQAIVDTLRTEVTRALASPDIRDRLKSVDTVPISLSTEASREWLRTNRKKWTDVITKMNIRPN